MNTNKTFLLLAAMLIPSSGFAAPKAFSCTSVETLDKNSEDCSHNPRYTKAGKECLEKLEKILADGTRIPADQLRKEAEASLAKQRGRSAKKGYKLSTLDSAKILRAAKEAKESVSAYRDNIFYPEDWDAPEELIGDPMDFLDSQKCYAEARDSLEKFEGIIDQYIRELERAKP